MTSLLSASVTYIIFAIVILGAETAILLLTYLISLVCDVAYKRMKGTAYFMSFVIHRKEFIKWHKENKGDLE